MFCIKCGTKLSDFSNYCNSCGNRMSSNIATLEKNEDCETHTHNSCQISEEASAINTFVPTNKRTEISSNPNEDDGDENEDDEDEDDDEDGEDDDEQDDAKNSYGITSLIIGISSLGLMFIPYLGIIVCVIGVVFGLLALGTSSHKNMAKVGLILCLLFGISSVFLNSNPVSENNKPSQKGVAENSKSNIVSEQGANSTDTSKNNQTTVTKNTPPSQVLEWNTREIDANKNGNIPVAVGLLKTSGNIKEKSSTSLSPAEIAKAPWNSYGKVVSLTGKIALVQDYPPKSDEATSGISSQFVLNSTDGTIVSFCFTQSSGSLKTDDVITIYGYPVGLYELENSIGGKIKAIVIIGNLVEKNVATIYPFSISYILGTKQEQSFTINPNGGSFLNVSNNGMSLRENSDYTINGNTLTINRAYLNALPAGDTKLTVNMNGVSAPSILITAEPGNAAIFPEVLLYGSDNFDGDRFDQHVILDSNGRNVVSIGDGNKIFNKGTDYTIIDNKLILKAGTLKGCHKLYIKMDGGNDLTLVVRK